MTELDPVPNGGAKSEGPSWPRLDLALIPLALLGVLLMIGATRQGMDPPPPIIPPPGYAMRGFVTFSGAIPTDVRVAVPPDGGLIVGGDLCFGAGPHADLQTGSPVVIHDEAGRELGRSVLYAGSTAEPAPVGAAPERVSCTMWFQAPGLPQAPKYFITVGNGRRYEVGFEQLEEWGWGVGIPIS